MSLTDKGRDYFSRSVDEVPDGTVSFLIQEFEKLDISEDITAGNIQ